MLTDSILVKNEDQNTERISLNFNKKQYTKNTIDKIELERLKFLEELFCYKDLNISKMQIIESNLDFLSNKINPKIEKISKNNNFINKHNNIKINSNKYFEKTNTNTNISNSLKINQAFKLKFLTFFESLSYLKRKLKFLYFDQEAKFFRDFTFVYFPISNLISEAYNNNKDNKPLIIGLQAHQGCGKTTMTSIISLLLIKFYDINCVNISIDDFYKSFEELNRLKEEKPEFKYRGPPGTHDIILAKSILDKIKNNEIGYYIPRYNKALNNGKGGRNDFGLEINFPVEVLLFEGWFLGAMPKDFSKLFQKKIKYKDTKDEGKNYNNEQIMDETKIHEFKFEEKKISKENLLIECNYNLKDYIELWNNIEFFISIRPENFYLSKKWRIQAEKKLKGGMDYKTIKDFVDYFWRSVPPEIYLDKLEELEKPLIKMIIDKNRDFYI